ncbi:helix-turn-helix domain-containing protein [Lactobacillus bombicola]|uniref:helix-turn-helix domain-containing protein n=1 Tax=Lactobacillus bombicola TaxID=1505723 RepID=UPI000E5903E3|nr:helix-turn-helix transcriptional regulator [Lactobacillus bombicola]RHW53257.1 XRE family transcriptional regulator [Lactobacillus bombicola]
MTLKAKNNCTEEIGKIIKKYRLSLNLKNSSRESFINYSIDAGLVPEGWISTKSLGNIERGQNTPSLHTLKLLATALDINFIDLINEIKDFV